MSISETFGLGLQLTGMGMGLVFLTLIIIMVAIWALDHAFRPRAQAEEAEASAEVERGIVAAVPLDDTDEIAAISAAILMERKKVTSRAPATPVIDYENDIVGEVVTVVTIDAGQGTWKGFGHIQAVR